jgi:hypothetical protein
MRMNASNLIIAQIELAQRRQSLPHPRCNFRREFGPAARSYANYYYTAGLVIALINSFNLFWNASTCA